MSNNNTPALVKKSNAVTGIQLYEDNVTNQARIIYQAILTGKVMAKINDYTLTEVLNVAITKIHVDLRKTLPAELDFSYMKQEILKRIRNKKYNLRDTEILIAFENGINEEYGQWYGLNAVTFNKFLAAYCATTNTDRMEALRAINAPKEQPKAPPSAEELFKISTINALEGYSLFLKDTHVMPDQSVVFGSTGRFGSVIFDFFYKIRMFFITQEEIDDIMKRGRELHFHELKVKRSQDATEIKRKETEKQIEKVLAAMQVENEQDPETNPLVVACAKRIYIDELFQGFYAEEITSESMEEIINSKKKYHEVD